MLVVGQNLATEPEIRSLLVDSWGPVPKSIPGCPQHQMTLIYASAIEGVPSKLPYGYPSQRLYMNMELS